MIEAMKKHKIPLIFAAVLIITAAAFFAGMSVKDSTADTTNEHFIGVEKAQEIAFADAGVKKQDVRITDADLEREDGAACYDIEFRTGDAAFDYKIDATNGTILETEKKPLKKADKPQDTQKPEEKTGLNSYIGVEKAKSIALGYVGVSAGAAHFTSAHLDTEDGVKIYELDFTANGKEYEFDINAYTGDVLDYDIEYVEGRDDDDDWDDDDDDDDDGDDDTDDDGDDDDDDGADDDGGDDDDND